MMCLVCRVLAHFSLLVLSLSFYSSSFSPGVPSSSVLLPLSPSFSCFLFLRVVIVVVLTLTLLATLKFRGHPVVRKEVLWCVLCLLGLVVSCSISVPTDDIPYALFCIDVSSNMTSYIHVGIVRGFRCPH